MSQEQPRRPVDDEQKGDQYGDVYLELAVKAAVVRDAESTSQNPVGLKLINEDDVSTKGSDLPGRRVLFDSVGGQVLYISFLFLFQMHTIFQLIILFISFVLLCLPLLIGFRVRVQIQGM